MRVRELLAADFPRVSAPGHRDALVQVLLDHDLPGVPVVMDSTNKLAGVVGRAEILSQPEETDVVRLMDPNPTTTYPEASLMEAARLLVEGRRKVLCAVTGSNQVVGVLDARRLLERLPVPRGLLIGHLPGAAVPVHAATPVRVAVEVARTTRAPALPVLDDRGRYWGLLLDGDLLRLSGRNDAQRVDALADRRAPTLPPTAPLETAVRLLLEGRRAIAIVDADGRVRDLVTDQDVLRATLDARA